MFGWFKKSTKSRDKFVKLALKDFEVPSFPAAVTNVMSMLRDPDSSVAEISAVLRADPGMSVLVLRTINSAAFGLRRKVVNIEHAVNLLGRSRLESIVVSLAVRKVSPKADDLGFDHKRFWHSCALRACTARVLAKRLHPATEVESFTSGLLLDLAVPMMFMARPEDYPPLYFKWIDCDEHKLEDLENKAFGFDHAQVGAAVACQWDLPESLVTAIGEHHRDWKQHPYPAVALASMVRDSKKLTGIEAVFDAASRLQGFDPETVSQIMDEATQEAGELSTLLNGSA